MDWLADRAWTGWLFLVGGLVPLAMALALVGAGLLLLDLETPGPGLLGWILLLWGARALGLAFKSFQGPSGRLLGPGEAPELEALLEAGAKAWQGPRRAPIVLDPEGWGVDLVGVPALGLLGWSRFRWVLGVKPLLALGTRELEVLAGWELVWWSDQQGWLNLQVKRLVAYWHRMEACTGREGPRAGALRAFLSWPVRIYASWVKGRFEAFLWREWARADQSVIDQFGAPTLGRALCRLAILEPLVARRVYTAWEALLKSGQALPEGLHQDLGARLGRWPEGVEGILDLALDGHVPQAPTLLRTRLERMGEAPSVPVPAAASAFHQLLGEGRIMKELDEAWSGRIQATQAEAREQEAREDLRHGVLAGTLGEAFPRHPDAREYLVLAYERQSPEAFGALLETFREAFPLDPDGRILALRHALRAGREEEAERLAGIFARENPFQAAACHGLLGNHWWGKGDPSRAERAWNLGRRAQALADQGRAERATASLKDDLEHHGLEEEQLAPVLAWLETHPRVREAFLVRKKVQVFPDRPVLLLVVRWKSPLWDRRGAKRLAFQTELAQGLVFPPEATGFVLVRGPILLAPWVRGRLPGLIARREGRGGALKAPGWRRRR